MGRGTLILDKNEFGFLQIPLRAEFLGVSFAPLSDHTEKLEVLQKDANKDGFYYPPQIASYSIDPRTDKIKKKIEQSEKPAKVYYLPPSHQISIKSPVATEGEPCTDEALIIYLLAYVYGTRLQPSKWKFEGRVPVKSVNNIYITNDTCLHFLEHVYTWWRKLTDSQRIKYVNILYAYTRATSLEWDWDAFLHQYMVFDALYNFHLEFKPYLKELKPTHKMRFNILCDTYSVFNEELVNRMYNARNNLFHEAMWVKSTIGFGSPDSDAYQLPFYLATLNAQIISSITGYKNEYARCPWWTWQTLEFDKIS